MPKFELPATPRNLAIAKFLAKADKSVKISAGTNIIVVSFDYGLNLQRLFIEKVVPDLTDRDWINIRKTVRNSLMGGKISSESELGLSIRPMRTRIIRLRVNPLEEQIIREAAKEAGKSLSDYIRGMVLRGAEEEEMLQKDFEAQMPTESTKRAQLSPQEEKGKAYVS